jgi:hypothetical protein
MVTLKDLDHSYIESLHYSIEQLEKSYQSIQSDFSFDLSKMEVSEAIINRLKAYYLTQGKIKTLLDKRYLAPASDYFVESVLFFLKLYLNSQGQQLQAHSERQIKKDKNSIRPDISIWKKEEVVAIIECKTQLGWNRDNWEQQYLERDLKLKSDFPNASSFLLVMTGINWGGFGSHIDLNSKYFCLLNDIWPVEFCEVNQIFTPIEALFAQLK